MHFPFHHFFRCLLLSLFFTLSSAFGNRSAVYDQLHDKCLVMIRPDLLDQAVFDIRDTTALQLFLQCGLVICNDVFPMSGIFNGRCKQAQHTVFHGFKSTIQIFRFLRKRFLADKRGSDTRQETFFLLRENMKQFFADDCVKECVPQEFQAFIAFFFVTVFFHVRTVGHCRHQELFIIELVLQLFFQLMSLIH